MKWLYCEAHRRIFKNEQDELRKHLDCRGGAIRYAGNESCWHVLYRPELLLDWLRLKLGKA